MFRVTSALVLLLLLAAAAAVHGHNARVFVGVAFWLTLIGLVAGRTWWLRHGQGRGDGDR